MYTRRTLDWRLLGSGLAVFAFTSTAVSGDWQVERLMRPTPHQLAAESQGSVVIYDGLEAGQVSAAMDQHFDRIESMMFTRIHHLPPTGAGGSVVIEDDGCD
jgi:hypothetical protein